MGVGALVPAAAIPAAVISAGLTAYSAYKYELNEQAEDGLAQNTDIAKWRAGLETVLLHVPFAPVSKLASKLPLEGLTSKVPTVIKEMADGAVKFAEIFDAGVARPIVSFTGGMLLENAREKPAGEAPAVWQQSVAYGLGYQLPNALRYIRLV